jgi:hypothetical protein
LWIALPCANPAAGGIDQDSIAQGIEGQSFVIVPKTSATVEHAGTSCPTSKSLETPGGPICSPNQSFIVHKISQVESFSAFTGANIPPGLPWLGTAKPADSLRTDVLQFEPSLAEFGGVEKVPISDIVQRGRRVSHRKWPAITQASSQFLGLAGSRAKPDSGGNLESSQPVQLDLHMCMDPTWDGVLSELVLSERPGLLAAATIQSSRLGQLGSHRLIALQPAVPAIEIEDGFADPTLSCAWQFPVSSKKGPKDSIGRMVAISQLDNFTG